MEIKKITIKEMIENIINSENREEIEKYFIYIADNNSFYGITEIDIINKKITYDCCDPDFMYYGDMSEEVYKIEKEKISLNNRFMVKLEGEFPQIYYSKEDAIKYINAVYDFIIEEHQIQNERDLEKACIKLKTDLIENGYNDNAEFFEKCKINE